jgi:hypothetical protein
MLKKKMFLVMALIIGLVAAFTLIGCGDDDGGTTGGGGGGGSGTGGLSGTYKSSESDADMTMTVTFSGNTLTMHVKMPMMGWDDDMIRCGYSVQGSRVIAVPPVWENPKFANLGGGGFGDNGGSGSGDNTIFTIVNATTLRDTEGATWTKQ